MATTDPPETGRRHYPMVFTSESAAHGYLLGVHHVDPDARLVALRREPDGTWAACLSTSASIDGDPGVRVPGAARGGMCGCGV
jgi:hypothetical protein